MTDLVSKITIFQRDRENGDEKKVYSVETEMVDICCYCSNFATVVAGQSTTMVQNRQICL